MDEILASIRRIISDDAVPVATEDEANGRDYPTVPPSGGVTTAHPAEPSTPHPTDLPEIDFSEPTPPAVTTASDAPPVPSPRMAAGGSTLETLVSRQATETIGHAFNALSHTILAQNARTLEDLVKDLLRPMLKVWLDDNLPPLVERLVRTEIERVARGNR